MNLYTWDLAHINIHRRSTNFTKTYDVDAI